MRSATHASASCPCVIAASRRCLQERSAVWNPAFKLLDLAGNNLTVLPNHLFHDFDFLRTLYLAENRVAGVNPGDALNGFQYSLYRLDLSGRQMGVTALHDLRR
ncbi:unnamed protein product [Timema podura]|uniref:Uncharacterized protein n=1 Tax=Timema podura TaxID=61482 RepID=A0ABN7PH52_TIMPD|nr:unnamed protein product [Timema podura]